MPQVLPESATQKRVVAFFQNNLGYRYLGDRRDRAGNSNIEEADLGAWLSGRGHSADEVSRAIFELRKVADDAGNSLYQRNEAVYQKLRYAVQVKTGAGEDYQSVPLIDWETPEANDFAIAEEVTLSGKHDRRPDLVLYVNGLALGVIELKRSTVGIEEGVRQLLSNQRKDFHEWFFSTVQFVFAGSNASGLHYGTIKTSEKYFLKWKEEVEENESYKLDKYLGKMCAKERFIELIRDFILFDSGVKKVPRVHQYFGIKAAQKHVRDYRGGIIWHTQGSGKSIVMVLLAQWILKTNSKARVLLVTDREALDKQIYKVFKKAGEEPHRATSGQDLMEKLATPRPRLLTTLVHKFGARGEKDFQGYLESLQAEDGLTCGELFVFVDECHRTESGKLHQLMKAVLKNAVFMGFTGTPLLKADKATTREVFGDYIHTYKFDEAVEDEVVLDLLYESRDIEQNLKSQEKIDEWFEAKTKGLNDWQKDALREKWGTMKSVLSSRSRMDQVVSDIIFDFGTIARLGSGRGNAMLVASSIYEAAKYYELFQKTEFKGRCALITSYNPQARSVSKEETGTNTETEKQFLFHLYTDLLAEVQPASKKSATETYEDQAKLLFQDEPSNMRLLIVVDKLLTGFDSPSCTYLYIDKKMRDHGLFQAICRTNRLDGEDKDFGYIVDYKDLFNQVQGAISVYTSELAEEQDEGKSSDVIMKDRLEAGRERLENALEVMAQLTEPVQPPKGELEYIRYFCGNIDKPEDLAENEPQRVAFYKCTAALIRAFSNIADDMERAGYSSAEADVIRLTLDGYLGMRQAIRVAANELLDLKAYEADMRFLIDHYLTAGDSTKDKPFGEMGLLDVIVNSGIADAIAKLPLGVRRNREAVAETIANNISSTIIKERLGNPEFFDRMSELLQEIIDDLKAARIDYEKFLKKMAGLAKQVREGKSDDAPDELNTAGRRAIFDNMGQDLETTLVIDEIVREKAQPGWRENFAKGKALEAAVAPLCGNDPTIIKKLMILLRQHFEY